MKSKDQVLLEQAYNTIRENRFENPKLHEYLAELHPELTKQGIEVGDTDRDDPPFMRGGYYYFKRGSKVAVMLTGNKNILVTLDGKQKYHIDTEKDNDAKKVERLKEILRNEFGVSTKVPSDSPWNLPVGHPMR